MPDVRMNYNSMEDMAKAFHSAHQQLEQTMREMEKVAKTMEDGALLGGAGDAFRDAVRSKLNKRLKVLAEKMQELERDIDGAVKFTRDGVKTAQSRFK
ncbi:MAG: WXG100 family type VII secretion target [Anaerolineales bacterium]|nr:WXG100 family type VII secretion target [Anaerolineales bacterium]